MNFWNFYEIFSAVYTEDNYAGIRLEMYVHSG